MATYIDRPRRDGKDADDWKPDNEAEVAALIDELYAAGRPLYPREVLQHVRDQLRKPLSNGDLIYVKVFDGSVYEYPVQTGNTKWRPDYGSEDEDKVVEWVLTTPRIYYTALEHLKRNLKWSLSRAYCSVGVAHEMVRKDQEPDPPSDFDAGLRFFNDALQSWKEGHAWKELLATLQSLPLRTNLHKVIGMACGDFTGKKSTPSCRRSAVQHALLLTIRNALQGSDIESADVACYAQDPAYTETDQSVLEHSGIQVVQDPEGYLQMDDYSLVFCCAPNICNKQIIADIARPAIMILDTVRNDDPEFSVTDPHSPRVHEMIVNDYDSYPFPVDDDNFTRMTMYVSKEALDFGKL
ncbi:hypothetical protein BDV19DRAFT_388810 [Aspergillus venezuelensis]